ncbi:hypothetical protein RvY_04383 [Ramazzottius varieornatus]|uniref:Uncharacterized protein n=1 Tax=Ramazzottius varieornatus TaxID=947166 RepID=A0A1D1V0Q2_RAMVA|nr:hypothetical protein RvY_04383 [Ramazzottius varieornatus]
MNSILQVLILCLLAVAGNCYIPYSYSDQNGVGNFPPMQPFPQFGFPSFNTNQMPMYPFPTGNNFQPMYPSMPNMNFPSFPTITVPSGPGYSVTNNSASAHGPNNASSGAVGGGFVSGNGVSVGGSATSSGSYTPGNGANSNSNSVSWMNNKAPKKAGLRMSQPVYGQQFGTYDGVGNYQYQPMQQPSAWMPGNY